MIRAVCLLILIFPVLMATTFAAEKKTQSPSINNRYSFRADHALGFQVGKELDSEARPFILGVEYENWLWESWGLSIGSLVELGDPPGGRKPGEGAFDPRSTLSAKCRIHLKERVYFKPSLGPTFHFQKKLVRAGAAAGLDLDFALNSGHPWAQGGEYTLGLAIRFSLLESAEAFLALTLKLGD